MSDLVDIVEFAERVERVCDFLLDKVPKDGSADVLLLQQLKEDAANIQFQRVHPSLLEGLDKHVRGHLRSHDESPPSGDR